jgi:hypothetical protein
MGGDFSCAAFAGSPKEIKVGESFSVAAHIANTFLDGSRVVWRVDGKAAGSKWAWSREGRQAALEFPLTFDWTGKHLIAVGGKKLEISVRP